MEQENQTKRKGSKISNTEWFLLILAIALLDGSQVILDFFVIGVIVNRIIDAIMGMAMPFYFWIRGVKMDSKKVLTMVGAFAGEMAPGLDALPLWTLDVLATMAWDKVDKKTSNLPI